MGSEYSRAQYVVLGKGKSESDQEWIDVMNAVNGMQKVSEEMRVCENNADPHLSRKPFLMISLFR